MKLRDVITPGEWRNAGFIGSIGSYHVTDSDNRGIASTGGPPGNAEAEANTTAIARVPELLEALEALTEDAELWHHYAGRCEPPGAACETCRMITDARALLEYTEAPDVP